MANHRVRATVQVTCTGLLYVVIVYCCCGRICGKLAPRRSAMPCHIFFLTAPLPASCVNYTRPLHSAYRTQLSRTATVPSCPGPGREAPHSQRHRERGGPLPRRGPFKQSSHPPRRAAATSSPHPFLRVGIKYLRRNQQARTHPAQRPTLIV